MVDRSAPTIGNYYIACMSVPMSVRRTLRLKGAANESRAKDQPTSYISRIFPELQYCRLYIAWMANFSFRVLVFGLPMPEYYRDGRVMVECNFSTPVSYKLRKRQTLNGEVHEHERSVTPYQVRVDVNATIQKSLFRLYVDGVLVNWNVLSGDKSFIFKGVCGSSGTRELLFDQPVPQSLAEHVHENAGHDCEEVAYSGVSKVGSIEVVQYEAIYRRSEFRRWKGVSLRHGNNTDFGSNAYSNYHRATSREGKLVEGINPYNYFNIWDVGRELSRQCVEYHMTETLQDMGICLTEIDWGKAPTTYSRVKNW